LPEGVNVKRFKLSRRELITGGIGFAAGLSGAGHMLVFAAGENTASILPSEAGTAPWDYWLSNSGSGTLRLASAAILAANPYNTQPWLFRLSEDRIELFADEGRNLAGLDPFRREFYIGLGCAIENASVAAPSQGTNANVALLPDPGKRGLAAAIQLQASTISRHPHHDAIALRHTHRGPYRLDRPITQDALNALTRQILSPDTNLLIVEAASPEGNALSGLMIEATARILETPALLEGRHGGLRIASAPNADNTEAALAKADADWLETTRKVHLTTASVFGLIMVRGARADHVLHMEAGRLWQRVHLEGTLQGLAMQPLNHLIEVIDHESFGSQQSTMRERMNLAADWKGWEPIFGFRLGYADIAAPRSPRRPLSMVVIG
jgi:hypothetical protein